MLQGIYLEIDNNPTGLIPGEKYYLFPNGSNYYYASRFPSEGSHMGIFQARRFRVIEEEEWPPEPALVIPELDKGKVYKARLIWRQEGYKNVKLQEYFIRRSKTHCHFYNDPEFKKYRGCFPLHWFENFRETSDHRKCDSIHEKVESEPPKIEKFEQLTLFSF
ncbi:hypothetical protein [Bacillus chungangensis]|uniref:Uncharacterized protein n=1 Tax=Bacillus chungangensis TaxID=587633 RepID=A0ABT9WRU7_9BACI|nr:hypothetical protein [Bacillus chungangensis]MDQ0176018.1 hypothetical protein [Bacillus chungangensis]